MHPLSFSERLHFLCQELGESERDVLTRALEAGLETLYRQQIGEQYLAHKISREDALEILGAIEITRLDCTLRQCSCEEEGGEWWDLLCGHA